MKLSVLYRGPLSSCNYACNYCPFSKRKESATQLLRDRLSLAQFTNWLAQQSQHTWHLLFTPWGEALVRRWYREAITILSHVPHIDSISIQTNLSCDLAWLSKCKAERVTLWATFHPTETSIGRFVRKVVQVRDQGIRICAGAVGVPNHLPLITELRSQLPPEVYLWINAQQPRPRPYTPSELDQIHSIDPHFSLTARRVASFGKLCPTGEDSFTVDGSGNMRRCHFVDQIIGNCYEKDWEQSLQSRPCSNRFCDCYLGLSQLLRNELKTTFGPSTFERVPITPKPF